MIRLFTIKLVLLILLLGCSDNTEDMRLFISSLGGGGNLTPQPVDVYRFGLIGDSIAVGRTDETDGQPSDLWDGAALSTVLTDNCWNWNGSALRTHRLNMNIAGDNTGGWGIEHRFAYNMIANNQALRVESLKVAYGSTGVADDPSSGYWHDTGTGITLFETELTQWGETLDVLFVILPINDMVTDARLAQLDVRFEPFLQRLVDNTQITKICLFEVVEALSVTPARLAAGKQHVLDAIAAVNSPKIVFIDNNPDWTFIDNVHPDVPSTDEMGEFAYNNR